MMDKPYILIVEDDAVAGETFQLMLAAEGHRARLAIDAEAGFTEIEQSTPSAIIVDLHLPTTDGLEFVRRLRSILDHADIPIAVITGDYLIDDHVAAELQILGARLFFKPLWGDDLCHIAERLINGHAASANQDPAGVVATRAIGASA
jgi:DNA-binding response OmpR family regulator